MKIMKKLPLTKPKMSKFFAITHQPKSHLPNHLKPPKANQTLKRYLNSNCNTKAILFFRELVRHSPSSIDSFSFLFVLKACTKKPFSLEGKQLHTQVIKFGFHPIIHLQTSLINFYSASGNLLDAHYMFDEIPSKNIISWTSLISAYVVNQEPQKAVELFRKMQMLYVEPDQVTITVALSACADLGALEMGEWIHAYVRRKPELKADLSLNNALINMYAKCGEIETARKLFDSLGEKDVTTWTSMIVGHALHGQANEALELFCKMEEIGKKNSKNQEEGNRGSSIILPNDVTFIGVLMACSHGGIVEEGKKYYRSMSEDYGLKPRDVHFGCMVDLFCRAGLLKEAYNFILEMPGQANAVMWRTLLGASILHGEIELGEKVRCQLLELEPGHVGDNVAMSNIYAAKGMWDKKVIVRDQIKQLRRAPGCSSIEVSSYISEFVSGDDDHPLKADIYEALKYLTIIIKAYG
ncbi:putative pentatricopeptide repeat-containing protein At1g74400 [Durio zibethinus]|uniref:Pentatricopeptide repeat-containing protein At1g74400 n=1 Tax=Durio zibethinus TaxID=66656 RepID=A0A6P5XJZ1_DURZI|nr:putative pentatricopeptide repeat-containing protein At1g74400 [Durio zibethinus]